ncbi:hypothetical protein GCM10027072_78250 [Streptomyces bullii]
MWSMKSGRGRFAVWCSHLAERAADVFGVEQALRGVPDPVSVPVKLQGGDPVDSSIASLR